MKSAAGALQRRFVGLLSAFLVLLFLGTTGCYLIFARSAMSQITLSSMQGQLDEVSTLLSMYAQGEIPAYMLQWLFDQNEEDYPKGDLFLYNRQGKCIYPQDTTKVEILPTDTVVRLALQGQSVTHTEFNSFYTQGVAILGQRIDPNNEELGVIFLVRDATEAGIAITSLMQAMTISLVSMILIFSIPVIRTIRSFIRPIGEIQTVANAMTRGDFSRRAREEYPGELGELARSLNRLSTRLYSALTDGELERSRLEEILNGLSEGILALDERGRITTANPMMLTLCGVQAIPEHRIALIDDRTFWKGVDLCIAENIALTCTMRLRDRSLQATLTPLVGAKGVNQGAVCMLRDITEAEALEQTRRDYVANVSHELKTPVSNMRIISETLMDGLITDPGELKRNYHSLLRESMRLSRLINDLLELSRLQSGTLYLEKERCDPNALLQEIESRYASLADDVGLEFHLEFPKGPCPEVYTNPDRASQIVVQLISNAVQYTPEGSITLSAEYDAHKVYVHVRDTGVGISPQDLPHVFDRFYKVDRSHSSGGTGLGLSIAREIVSQMNETLTVSSREGEGSCFTLTLERYTREGNPDENP